VKTIPAPNAVKRSHFAKYQKGCQKDVEQAFSVLQQRFAIVRYPALTWLESQMLECMKCCVVMHNMIIKSEREEPVEDDWPFDHEGPLAKLDQVSVEFPAFLAMHKKSATEMNIIVFRRISWSICVLLEEMLIYLIYFLFQLLYE
jgi:hypothetical protein